MLQHRLHAGQPLLPRRILQVLVAVHACWWNAASAAQEFSGLRVARNSSRTRPIQRITARGPRLQWGSSVAVILTCNPVTISSPSSSAIFCLASLSESVPPARAASSSSAGAAGAATAAARLEGGLERTGRPLKGLSAAAARFVACLQTTDAQLGANVKHFVPLQHLMASVGHHRR